MSASPQSIQGWVRRYSIIRVWLSARLAAVLRSRRDSVRLGYFGSTRVRTPRSIRGTTTAASVRRAAPEETPQVALARRISCTLA